VTRQDRATLLIAGSAVAVLSLAGCAAGDPRFTADAPAGFWAGLWHGAISAIALVVGMWSDTVRVYETHNTGGWYDLGFWLGIVTIWGAGHRAGRKPKRDPEWEEIGRKVEAKLKRTLRAWADAEPGDDWREVEAKAERKLKERLRRWAEAPTDEAPASVE
jgi:hypothetical protein